MLMRVFCLSNEAHNKLEAEKYVIFKPIYFITDYTIRGYLCYWQFNQLTFIICSFNRWKTHKKGRQDFCLFDKGVDF